MTFAGGDWFDSVFPVVFNPSVSFLRGLKFSVQPRGYRQYAGSYGYGLPQAQVTQITQGEEVGYVDYDPIIPVGQQNPGILYPGVLTPRPHTTGTSVPTVGAPVFEPGSIFGPGGGMGSLPDDAYDPPPPDTRADETPLYDEYEGEVDVAIDWGSVFSAAVDVAQGQFPGGIVNPGSPLGTGFAGPAPSTNGTPAKVTVDTRTGAVTPCRRRRRRRLLTSTDINDLAALKAIVGGGQAMNLAVAKAVRR